MSEVVEAAWAQTPPDFNGEKNFWMVGKPIWVNGKCGPAVTRITVQEDLPGLHCNMRRVCVWVDDTLVVEAPVHSLEAIGYPDPQEASHDAD